MSAPGGKQILITMQFKIKVLDNKVDQISTNWKGNLTKTQLNGGLNYISVEHKQ